MSTKITTAAIAIALLTACGYEGFEDPEKPKNETDPIEQPSDDDEDGKKPGKDDAGMPAECPESEGLAFTSPKPNVVLLIDRSGSMAEPSESCTQAPCMSKWDEVLALTPYLELVKERAHLGLNVFPATWGHGCNGNGGGLVDVSDDDDVDVQIIDALHEVSPDGGTPVAEALVDAAASGQLEDPNRDNVIVLLTDGEPTCGPCFGGQPDAVCQREHAVDAVRSLGEREIPVELYTIGFTTSKNTVATETLEAMADAAAVHTPGETFYEAGNAEELVGRLFQVAGALQSCTLDLATPVAAADLTVQFDGEKLTECSSECGEGYTYDEEIGRIELEGFTCTAWRDGTCHDLAIYAD